MDATGSALGWGHVLMALWLASCAGARERPDPGRERGGDSRGDEVHDVVLEAAGDGARVEGSGDDRGTEPGPGEVVGQVDLVCVPSCADAGDRTDDGCGGPCPYRGPGGRCWPCVDDGDCRADHRCDHMPPGSGWGSVGPSYCAQRASTLDDCPTGMSWTALGLCRDTHCYCTGEAAAVRARGSCKVTFDLAVCPGTFECRHGGDHVVTCSAHEPRPELCDGSDDDCDGEVDEDCTSCLDPTCLGTVCTEDCGRPECAANCCDRRCFVCQVGQRCVGGHCCQTTCDTSGKGLPCGPDGCGGSCGRCPYRWHCEAGLCQPNQACQELLGKPGCSPCACQECTCANDPYCCDGPWDDACVVLCATTCGGCGPCTPSCAGKACGPDGCGGSCGACPPGAPRCLGGTCTGGCVPDCVGRECGPDGCGGSCGACVPPNRVGVQTLMECTVEGHCACRECMLEAWGATSFFPCPPSGDCDDLIVEPGGCEDAECGENWMWGGSCGDCHEGSVCLGGHCGCAYR